MSPEVVAQTLEDGKLLFLSLSLSFVCVCVASIALKLQEESVLLSTSLFSLKHKICS